MKFISRNLVYIYTALWMLYLLQKMLVIYGTLAQIILIVITCISFYAFIKVNVCYKTPLYLKWLVVMLLILTIYGLIPILGGESFHKSGYVEKVSFNYYYLQKIYQSILPIYAYYYFTLKGNITSKNIVYLFGIIMICCVFMYFQGIQVKSAKFDREEFTNNIGYYFVPLIPMLYLMKIKEIWKYIAMSFIFFYIMISMKRGAILVGSVALVSYMAFQLRKVTKKHVLYILGLSGVVLYAVYRVVTNLYENSPYFKIRLDRTLSGDTSRRDVIYRDYLNYFIDRSSWMEFLFGQGASGTLKTFGQWAHNDWLEFAINHGMLGVILYIVYWCVFVYEWKNFRGLSECKRALRDCLIIYFLVALFSMSFNGMPIAATLCIGYCLGSNVVFFQEYEEV